MLDGLPAGLATHPLTTPMDLDMIWGAAFATGDPAFVRRILEKIAEAVRSKDIAIDDILYVARGPGAEKSKVRATFRKYVKPQIAQLLLYSSAFWSVASNAKQHEFVEREVDRWIGLDPTTDVARTIRRVKFRSFNPVMSKAETQSFTAVVSQLSDARDVRSVKTREDARKAMAGFKHDFRKGGRVYIAVLLLATPNTEIRYAFEIMIPGGGVHRIGPFDKKKSASYTMSMDAVEITEKELMEEGIYTVRGAFRDGLGSLVNTENRFLLSGVN